MEWETLLQDLIALVSNTAPLLWAIALKQVYVKAAQGMIAVIGFVAGSIYLWKQAVTFTGKYDSGDRQVLKLLSIVCVVGVFVGTAIIAGYLINPEFYAIELLVDYVKP